MYKIEYKIINNKKDCLTFDTFKQAKKIYIAFISNLTIKAAKLYEETGNKKKIIEKFSKKRIYPESH